VNSKGTKIVINEIVRKFIQSIRDLSASKFHHQFK